MENISSSETPSSAPENLRRGQKRSRADSDDDARDIDTSVVGKRTRTKLAIPGADDDVNDYVPVALQKDDISEEVERRLRLREERREKRGKLQPAEKRKRDSDGDGAAATKPETEIRKRHKSGTVDY